MMVIFSSVSEKKASLGDEGTEQGTYIGMMQYDVDTIVQALK